MYTDILIGLMTGLVSGIASGFIVYLITKQKEENRFVFQFWMDFLFKVMERNEVYCPTEQLRYISKGGKKGSKWYGAIKEILSIIDAFEVEEKEFSKEGSLLAENVIIALGELSAWAKKKRIK